MIPCPKCSHVNPLGTRFCRSCGEKLDVKVAQVMASVEQKRDTDRDERIYKAGRGALTLTVFALVCALTFRWLIVPDMPAPELPAVALGDIEPKPAASEAAVDLPLGATTRLAWRREHGSALLSPLGVDLVQLQAWSDAIAKEQRADGSFPGQDALAATGLAALALQAYPREDRALAAAASARAWLKTNLVDLSQKRPLGRTLGMAALLDAQELPLALQTNGAIYLIDARAPVFQAFAYALYDAKDRPQDVRSLRSAGTTPEWGWYFDALTGKPPEIEVKAYFTESAKRLAKGEDRLVWAFTAWHFAAAPKDLIETLSAWSRAQPPPVADDLVAACGPNAAAAVALIAVASPARVPPLWLSAK